MRQHTPHTTISIISWDINKTTGLNISYSIGLNNYHLQAEPFRATTLLSNCYLIDERKIVNGRLYVRLWDNWIPFNVYAACTELSSYEALDLVKEHEATKAICGVMRYSALNMFSNN